VELLLENFVRLYQRLYSLPDFWMEAQKMFTKNVFLNRIVYINSGFCTATIGFVGLGHKDVIAEQNLKSIIVVHPI
jgi:hypothetical protein